MAALLQPLKSLLHRLGMTSVIFWLSLILLMLALEFAGLKTELRYDRQLIEAGQWYRLLTANLVHLNLAHLLLNLAGLLIVIVFFSRYLRSWQWLLLILISSLAVTIGLYLFNPGLGQYVGFSGTVHGLFLLGALREIRRFPLSGWLLFAVLVAKLVWEQLYGAMPGSGSIINGRVIVDSHLYGAIAGVLYFVWLNRFRLLK